jgi:hypothetical protein
MFPPDTEEEKQEQRDQIKELLKEQEKLLVKFQQA